MKAAVLTSLGEAQIKSIQLPQAVVSATATLSAIAGGSGRTHVQVGPG
ncbi:hypothetical protein [Actinoplanes sp. NBRC 103695]|nr:hypothetical protein [Actinoplanes sp. NBRC 103695]